MQSVSVLSIFLGFLCSVIILIDIISGSCQHMKIMNIVWPITGLYAGPLALLAYYTIGKKTTHNMMEVMQQRNMKTKKPFWQSVVTGALHCGSGCTLGDMLAEFYY